MRLDIQAWILACFLFGSWVADTYYLTPRLKHRIEVLENINRPGDR